MKLLKLILAILFYLSFNKKEINQNKFQQNNLNNNISIINNINNFNHINLFDKILINKHSSKNIEQNYLNKFFNNKVNNNKFNNDSLNQNKLNKQSLKNNISSRLFSSRKKYKNNLINYTKLKNINQNYQSNPIKNNINFIKINLTKAVLNKNYQRSLIKNYQKEFF